MTSSRRDFLKFVLAGSAAAACPIDLSALASSQSPQIEGEHYDICHQVRDGHVFQRPSVSRRHDIVIIGGGVSGLSAAYFLRQHDFLLLEKEPHWGGNASLEIYEGHAFATGSAFDTKDSFSDRLARELGLNQLPINSPDPTIVRGKWVADTWRGGLDDLPYPASVRDSFKKFRRQMMALDLQKDRDHLDSIPLTRYLKDYPPEIAEWWDAYGPSNWGAWSADTSVYVAAIDLQEMAGDEPDARITLPGGNGALAQKLSEVLQAKFGEQMLAGATTIAVEPLKDEVHVTYLQGTQLRTVAAKFVVMATPKFITAKILAGLPEDQFDAMKSIRYCPYPVINMIFDRLVYDKAYDTWCPGNAFTDFVVADWVVRNQPQPAAGASPNPAREEDARSRANLSGTSQAPGNVNILTFYVPMLESNRSKLLHEEDCRSLAARVLDDFKKLLPEFNQPAKKSALSAVGALAPTMTAAFASGVLTPETRFSLFQQPFHVDPVEVRFYRRGHPMFLPTPGTFTKTIPAASRPLDRVYFANTDSIGPVSDIGAAVESAERASEWIESQMGA